MEVPFDDDGGNRDELAEDRTEWAMQRTLLAKERTYIAWARTGISSMIAGLGIAQFLSEITFPILARSLAVILIITGGILHIIAYMSYRKALKRLTDVHIRSTALWVIKSVTLGLMISAILALIIILSD